uniref:Uncharacterized protein MANES_01G164100 n=1 Tax=Rhizophora mucronata TaxID=61149 RepID=A0A2P2J1K5_RHIMU
MRVYIKLIHSNRYINHCRFHARWQPSPSSLSPARKSARLTWTSSPHRQKPLAPLSTAPSSVTNRTSAGGPPPPSLGARLEAAARNPIRRRKRDGPAVAPCARLFAQAEGSFSGPSPGTGL